MLDPVPFGPPPFLAAVAKQIGAYFELSVLHLHIHEVLLAALFYHSICLSVSPWISTLLFPNTYPKLQWRTKLNWDVHVVSFVQSTMIVALALYVIINDKERQQMDFAQRVWGYTGASGLIQALALGYFLWDLWISVAHVNIFGLGLLAHAFSAFYVYSLGFRPFTNYYAPSFILYELSSPFLNIHWFLDKLALTGSNLQLFNGILLMSTFFGSRLIWGVYQSYCVFSDIFQALELQQTQRGITWLVSNARHAREDASSRDPMSVREIYLYTKGRLIPSWYAYTYLAANITLTLLNIYWFGKMIETIRKRFDPPFGTRQPAPKAEDAKELLIGRGVLGDGTKTVEIDVTEVRRRRVPVDEVPPPQ